jgi:hypothetical protein
VVGASIFEGLSDGPLLGEGKGPVVSDTLSSSDGPSSWFAGEDVAAGASA